MQFVTEDVQYDPRVETLAYTTVTDNLQRRANTGLDQRQYLMNNGLITNQGYGMTQITGYNYQQRSRPNVNLSGTNVISANQAILQGRTPTILPSNTTTYTQQFNTFPQPQLMNTNR